jgi:N-acetylmuramoyl-L-alanine amidase
MCKIILDAGHGINTPGKRSPDGRFREYKFNRIIRDAVAEHLRLRGYNVEILTPEETDVPLPERVDRANRMSCQIGQPIQSVIIVSIHANAAGNGSQWMKARGWCAYTCKGHTLSDELATCLYKAARKYLPGQRIRTDYTDGDPDFEAQFYLLRNTYAAAVLTENLFYDNPDDLAFLESIEGQKAIVALHVEGIVDFMEHVRV